ncbi:MAG: adenosylmethionine--8-amino-7-oxononanoate transaminase [Candidatus Pseudobacter hemicellulosilyticus]|uniref:Adenosylmethionine-8-amino-7-oxononanoate aminotransferase n=1 Tax=Candidatus Pseudobacter hemicellulosilyticus TaxID=3121375 RepID=A0AAJ5X128_9BACT|nr:MAG: adenosylmethionine--8-amino-7-oxononanoate transaminase [Pseudobacter sp.]
MQETLTSRDQQVIWHPFTPQKYMPAPIPITRGEGIYLVDADGRRYLDAISSWWVTIHGHAHPYIAEKIYQQALTLEQVIFAGFTHEPAVSLAERLLPLLPGPFARVFYSDNGSTAVEVALKMAVQYWWNQGQPQRNKILAFKEAYHGDTFGAMSVSGRSIFTQAFNDKLFEVIFLDTPSPLGHEDPPEAAAHRRQQLEQLPWDQVACFIYEPLVQGAGGMRMHRPEGLDLLLAACRQQGVLCIADEVMTGFGRTNQLFASHWLQHSPDIICLSKGLTGGTLPLGITACKDFLYEAFVQDDKLKTLWHGHSFTANPLACAASLASLDLLLDPACTRQRAMISRMQETFLDTLAGSSLPVRNGRCTGTLLAFEVIQEKDGYLNTISADITRKALDKGVFLRPLGNTLYLMPPYCITEPELKYVYEVILEILYGL